MAIKVKTKRAPKPRVITPMAQLASSTTQAYKPPQAVLDARQARATDELGGTGAQIYWGKVEEPYLPELRFPEAANKYREMLRRDPTITSADVAVKLMAHTSTWGAEPGGNTDADKRARDHLGSCMDDMSHEFGQGIENAISSVWNGWYLCEIVLKRRLGVNPPRSVSNPNPAESKYADDRFGWRKFAPRKQSSLSKWESDETGGVQGMWQTIIPASGAGVFQKFIPIERALLFNPRHDPGNPEGLSFLEPIYETWHFVKNLAIIQGIGFERSFTGLPTFKYTQTPTAGDEAIVERTGKALRVGSKSYVAIPSSIDFDLKDSSNTVATPLLETIKYYRTLMLQTIFAQFLSLPANGVGSFALGQDQSALFLMIVDALLDNFADVYNRFAVPRLFSIAANDFGQLTDYPRITHTVVQKPNLAVLGTYLTNIASYVQPLLAGGNPIDLANQLLANAGLPLIPKPDESAPAPETGNEEPDESEMAHPPARGIKYYQIQFERAMKRFERAIAK